MNRHLESGYYEVPFMTTFGKGRTFDELGLITPVQHSCDGINWLDNVGPKVSAIFWLGEEVFHLCNPNNDKKKSSLRIAANSTTRSQRVYLNST